MLKYNIDDNLVGQLTIIHPPIVELYHEQSWDKGPASDSRSSSPLQKNFHHNHVEPVEIYWLEPGSFHSHCPATQDPKVEDRLAGSDLTGCRSGSSSYGV